jgi:hypothetical protein
MGAKSCQLWAVAGLQEPRATRLPRIPGLGTLQDSSSSSSVGNGTAGNKVDGSSVCLAVLEPRFTLSSGLEVGGNGNLTTWSGVDCRFAIVKSSIAGNPHQPLRTIMAQQLAPLALVCACV